MREIPPQLAAVLEAFDAYHARVAVCEERYGALLIRDDRCPNVYDANHVRRILSADAEVSLLLEEAERVFADRHYRSFRLDARVAAPRLESQLALRGYQPSAEILMTLAGDVRGRAASVRIAPLEGEDAWLAWRYVKQQDTRAPWFATIGDEWVAYVRRKTPAVRYFGAFDGADLLGSFSVFLHDGVGYLEDLLVAPAARRRGVATALVAHCAHDARRRGAQLLFLPAAADDTPKAMYAAMGFTAIGIAWNWLLRHEE
jgi:ribosomal protein S18 acetylase RimI-like enzyme